MDITPNFTHRSLIPLDRLLEDTQIMTPKGCNEIDLVQRITVKPTNMPKRIVASTG